MISSRMNPSYNFSPDHRVETYGVPFSYTVIPRVWSIAQTRSLKHEIWKLHLMNNIVWIRADRPSFIKVLCSSISSKDTSFKFIFGVDYDPPSCLVTHKRRCRRSRVRSFKSRSRNVKQIWRVAHHLSVIRLSVICHLRLHSSLLHSSLITLYIVIFRIHRAFFLYRTWKRTKFCTLSITLVFRLDFPAKCGYIWTEIGIPTKLCFEYEYCLFRKTERNQWIGGEN